MEPPRLTECGECGAQPVDGNSRQKYCSECGAGPDPWEREPEYDFERDVSLPFIFSDEQYNDDHGLWREFCHQAFGAHELRGSHIANLPDGLPKMKYNVFTVYYKLDEDLELHGPFLDKQEARDA